MLEKQAKVGPVPALAERPEVFDDLMPFWIGFNDLHKARQVGFGPSPLSIKDITAFLRLRGIPRFEWEEWFDLISAMDATWLDWAREKIKSEISKK